MALDKPELSVGNNSIQGVIGGLPIVDHVEGLRGSITIIEDDFRKKERGDDKKKDGGKPMWDLLPLKLISPIVDVLTFGAKKYSPNSWQSVENAEARYFAAMMRHIERMQSGEEIDPESGLTHISHIQCNAMFLQYFYQEKHK